MAARKYRIGIDLGGTNIKAGVIDDENNILVKKSVKTLPLDRSWQEIVADMATLTRQLLAELSIGIDECSKIGVGAAGMIDHINGIITYAGNFGWTGIPIVTELHRYFDLPIRIANDANCAVLGESVAGAAKGAKHILMLTLGTGVGAGVIADGHLQEGGSAGGMELGHTLLVMDGEECTCGRRGCLEAYASAASLTRHARKAAVAHPDSILNEMCKGNLANMNGVIPFKAARAGDETAKRLVDEYIKYLGEGIINFINAWRPEKVLIGGGLSNEGDPLIIPLQEYVRPRCFGGEKGYVAPIERAVLGNDAGLIGAASL